MVVQLSQINEYLGSLNMTYDDAQAGYMSVQLMLLTYDFDNARDG